MKYEVEYDNDTGPDDEGFYEFWKISNGESTFTAYSEGDANWLCELLNKNET